MARSGTRFEAGAKELIQQLTGFDESDENFKLSVQFALSNFNFHRFLSVDSHKITRELRGLEEKFRIHSQHTKAENFRKLLEEYLDSHAFEYRDRGKTDTHYAMLSLLLSLADRPLEVDFEPSVKAKQKEETEKFDWKSYLLEDIEDYKGPWPDDSSDSEWEDDISPTSSQGKHFGYKDKVALKETESEDSHLICELDEGYHGDSWLSRNLIVQYWQGEVAVTAESDHSSAKMTRTWEEFLSQSTQLFMPGQNSELTEYHLMRETLWLLQGFGSTYLYSWDGNKYVINLAVVTSHLTSITLLNLLDTLAQAGTLVRKLQKFVSNVMHSYSQPPFDESQNKGNTKSQTERSQTYEAFADALSKYLLGFRKELVEIENVLKKQEATESLTSLIDRLKPRFSEIDVIYQVYDEGVLALSGESETSRKASGLLAAIYNAFLDCDNKGSQQHMTHLLLRIWLQTCRPYWDIIDTWINLGLLRDQHLEFIIQRNVEVKSLDETFWSTAFTSHMTSSSKPGIALEDYEIVGWPQFFLPILEHVVVAGKSMEMLQCLGRLSDVVLPGASRKSLFEMLLESLEEQLGLETESSLIIASKRRDSDIKGKSYEDIYTEQISRQMYVKGTGDPLIRKNFVSMTIGKLPPSKDGAQTKSREVKESAAIYGKPIEQVLTECIYPRVIQRKEEVSETLLRVLQEDYHLHNHLTACRHILLLEAGDTMYDFYTDIFEKLRLREPWKDVSYLTTLLHEALSYHFPSYTKRFFVSISSTSDKEGPLHAIDALNGLTLHYKVSWPVDVVLHSKSMTVYNQVFHFLLQIKRTKYCLDCLNFKDLDDLIKNAAGEKEEEVMTEEQRQDEERQTQCFLNHMRLMRIRLLHFVNSLHNYIMTRILHSTALDLEESLNQVSDLDQVIAAHNHFISTIHERCLLHKQVRLLKDAIVRMLNMALRFTQLWQETHSVDSFKELSQMEADLTRCIQFLSSFLNNIIKRGSFPHLESLAFALLSSSEHIQR